MRSPQRRCVRGLPSGAARGRQRLGAASQRLRPKVSDTPQRRRLPSPQALLDRLRPSLGARYPAFDVIVDRAAAALERGAATVLMRSAEDRAAAEAALSALQRALWAEMAYCPKTEEGVDAALDLTQTATGLAMLFGVWLGQSGRGTVTRSGEL
jgi:hypothetical protein